MRRCQTTATVLIGLGLLGACRGQLDPEPPVVPIRNMYNQPRYDPQEKSDFFEDGRTMRNLVKGVVAREMEINPEINTGLRLDGGGWLINVPGTVVRRHGGGRAMLDRGRERYNIYCAPCHSRTGDGEGMVSRRAVEIGASALKARPFTIRRSARCPTVKSSGRSRTA